MKTTLASLSLIAQVATFACGCGAHVESPANAASLGEPLTFAFRSLDEKPADAESYRGRPLVLSFFSTGDLSSQAQTNFLVVMAGHDAGKVGYLLVALEPASQRELIEIYRQTLRVPFAVAIADDRTLAGESKFGPIPHLPTVIVLDGAGKLVKRFDGHVATSQELRSVLRELK